MLVTLGALLSLPAVQTIIAQKATTWLNNEFGTDISLQRIAIKWNGRVNLDELFVRDHKKDTLFFIQDLQTHLLDIRRLVAGDLDFGDTEIKGLHFHLNTYKGENFSNLDLFIEAFDDGQPSSGKFEMNISRILLQESMMRVWDENQPIPLDAAFYDLNTDLENFKIKGPNVFVKINDLSFVDHRGLNIIDLESQFEYTKTHIYLDDLIAHTPYSTIQGRLHMRYNREDFADFINKVIFDGVFLKSKVHAKDIKLFYSDFSEDAFFDFSGAMYGTLNKLKFSKLNVQEGREFVMQGQASFDNIFTKSTNDFKFVGDFSRLTTNKSYLENLVPALFQDNIPDQVRLMGNITLTGSLEMTAREMKMHLNGHSNLGQFGVRLFIDEYTQVDQAAYHGQVMTEQFHLGKLLQQKDIGTITADVFVDGFGFTPESLDTHVKGYINRLYFNGYSYSRIKLDGTFKQPLFSGKLNINDPNLFMDFDGLVDFSKSEERYHFDVKVDYADMNALKFAKDSIAIFKGKLVADVEGNKLDDVHGTIQIFDSWYQNARDIYLFDDFLIRSEFDDNKERSITVKAPGIIDGRIVGKYSFSKIVPMVENALGSLYSNYKRHEIKEGQYLFYDLSVYNKIIEIFVPEISLSKNTRIFGSINGDNDDLKVNFDSPALEAYGNKIYQMSLSLDSKNILYNTFMSIDSVRNSQYTFTDINLLNIARRDSLFFRIETKGGGVDGKRDFYNVNLFHTINEEKNSVIGFRKSEFYFKDYMWYMNEEQNQRNRLIVDRNLHHLTFDEIVLTHEDQRLMLDGFLNDSGFKNVALNFENVNLAKITPDFEGFAFSGTLDGFVKLIQEERVYKPTAELTVQQLHLNDTHLGTLNFDVIGNDSFNSFSVDASLRNGILETFSLLGSLFVQDKTTNVDLDLRMDNLDLGGFANIGGEVISNIRGQISGTAAITGSIDSPNLNGRVFLNQAGMSIPYLNVNYNFARNSIIDITEREFIFNRIFITDAKFQSEGTLSGSIRHNGLQQWQMDLRVDTNRLLVLDTKDSEDALYFGQGFISGFAALKGPIDNMLIEINATSQRGTSIKIPIGDTEALGERNYVRFITPEEKFSIQGEDREITFATPDGLEMKFNFVITEDADIEVILDRESGHGMRGKGTGNLLMEINTNGKFNMYGDYTISEGLYNFRYRGLFDKRLEVRKQGTIVWDGDPLRARLNIEAVYRTRSNPAVIIENSSFNRKVDTEVIIGVTGTILNPDIDFDFDFPNVSSVFKSEIQSKLDNRENRETQAIYVLATGNFISLDGALGQNALTNNVFETLGGMLDNIFRDEEGKISVGVDVVSADRTPGREVDGSVGVTTSFNINDRISVNGKVGVPVGGINESTVVGNVEVLYRLNNSGTSNLRAFNRETDINYIGQGIGFTQGVGIGYEVDFTNFSELVKKIFTKRISSDITNASDQIPDSDYSYEYIKFINERNRRQQEQREIPKTENAPEGD